MMEYLLEDILSEPTRNGLTKPKAIRGYGVPMIAMGEIFAFSRIAAIEMDRVPVTSKELASSSIKEGDILFARQSLTLEGAGKCSIVTRVTEPTVFESHLIRVRVNQNMADPYYVYYYFNSAEGRNKVKGIVEQVAAAGIRGSDLIKLKINLPQLKKQHAIAGLLRMIDEKRENNNQINDNLLQQALAIFNDRYDSADEQCSFTSLIHVLGGGTPKTGNPEFWNGDIPFFTPKDVGSPYTFQTEKTITPAGLEHCNSRLYPKNTSFVTARGTVGKVSLAGKPMAMNQSCYALASDSIDPILVYFYALRAVDSLKHKASGAVFDAIVIRDFETEVVSVIPETECKAVLALITPMMKAIHTNAEENILLAALRDALLPRLMSGEIDVSHIAL